MKTQPEAKRVFEWPTRVYYEDTDAGGVVFYANYLKFFERARTEWLRSLGMSQEILKDTYSLLFVVGRISVDYIQSARLDDLLTITVEVERIGRASIYFYQRAYLGETLLATAQIQIVSVLSPQMKPLAIPSDILSKMKAAIG